MAGQILILVYQQEACGWTTHPWSISVRLHYPTWYGN